MQVTYSISDPKTFDLSSIGTFDMQKFSISDRMWRFLSYTSWYEEKNEPFPANGFLAITSDAIYIYKIDEHNDVIEWMKFEYDTENILCFTDFSKAFISYEYGKLTFVFTNGGSSEGEFILIIDFLKDVAYKFGINDVISIYKGTIRERNEGKGWEQLTTDTFFTLTGLHLDDSDAIRVLSIDYSSEGYREFFVILLKDKNDDEGIAIMNYPIFSLSESNSVPQAETLSCYENYTYLIRITSSQNPISYVLDKFPTSDMNSLDSFPLWIQSTSSEYFSEYSLEPMEFFPDKGKVEFPFYSVVTTGILSVPNSYTITRLLVFTNSLTYAVYTSLACNTSFLFMENEPPFTYLSVGDNLLSCLGFKKTVWLFETFTPFDVNLTTTIETPIITNMEGAYLFVLKSGWKYFLLVREGSTLYGYTIVVFRDGYTETSSENLTENTCEITGTLVDATGNPAQNELIKVQIVSLPYKSASVFWEGELLYVSTDENGKFSFSMPIGATIRVLAENFGIDMTFVVPEKAKIDIYDL